MAKRRKKVWKNPRELDDELYWKWRNAVVARDGKRCQLCDKNLVRTKFHVHHIKRWANFEYLRYDINNGVVLCVSCHSRRVNGKEESFEPLFMSKVLANIKRTGSPTNILLIKYGKKPDEIQDNKGHEGEGGELALGDGQ
jgi:hypothetical protein